MSIETEIKNVTKLAGPVEVIAYKDYLGPTKLMYHELEHMTLEAKMAASFVERWGMVAGAPDGEDSAGRAKLKLTTVEETVTRAVTMAEHLANVCREKGYIIAVPGYEGLDKQGREAAAEDRGRND